MNILTSSIFVLGLVLLSGGGVESQLNIDVGIPFGQSILNIENVIYDLLTLFRASSNFRTNAMMINGAGGAGGRGGAGGSGGGELADSIKGLLGALVKAGGNRTPKRLGVLAEILRFINTVIANTIRTSIRLLKNLVFAMATKKVSDTFEQGKKKLLDILDKLRPLNALKSLGKGPVAKVFNGKRLKALLNIVSNIIKNRIQNYVNDVINRFKAYIRKLPLEMVDKVLKMRDKIKNRPKLLQNLADRFANIIHKGREKSMARIKNTMKMILKILSALIRLVAAKITRNRDKWQTRLFTFVNLLSNSIGRIGDKLSKTGPIRMLIGLGLKIVSNRIKMIADAFRQLWSGIQSIFNGISGILRGILRRAVSRISNYWFTTRIANKLVEQDRRLRILFDLVTRPSKFVESMLPKLVENGIKRRMDRRRALRDWLSKVASKLPRPKKNLPNILQNLAKKKPLRNALKVTMRITSDLGKIIVGFIRIFIQFVPILRDTISRSFLLRILLGGGRRETAARTTLTSRLAQIINRVTNRISSFTGAGGAAGAATNALSGLAYAFDPLRSIFSS